MATLFGLSPKSVNCVKVEAGMELRPVGAVPVLVEVAELLLIVLVGLEEVDEADPTRHWL